MNQKVTLLTIFGTRPEVIKLAPVLAELKRDSRLQTVLISTGQQADLIPIFLESFGLKLDDDLALMVPGQSLNRSLAKMIDTLDEVFAQHSPSAVIVQGDTSSALAGAIAARFRAVPVVHIEAGLRTNNPMSPFPEESNRRLISHIAAVHCAPTDGNVENLLNEGISKEHIFCTGNPVVDALKSLTETIKPTKFLATMLDSLRDKNIVVATVHRRENIGDRLSQYLTVVNDFITQNEDCVLVLPVHPNPMVKQVVIELLANSPRVFLIDPLAYADFICLLQNAWLVLSDSGGIQEEVVTLGKPLLILRDCTERPEVVDSGCARLAESADVLRRELEQASQGDSWINAVGSGENPFGDGRSGPRIAQIIRDAVHKSALEA